MNELAQHKFARVATICDEILDRHEYVAIKRGRRQTQVRCVQAFAQSPLVRITIGEEFGRFGVMRLLAGVSVEYINPDKTTISSARLEWEPRGLFVRSSLIEASRQPVPPMMLNEQDANSIYSYMSPFIEAVAGAEAVA